METITAKQVEGAVDTTTDQSIGGVKSFTSTVNFFPADPTQFVCIKIEGLYIYWLKDSNIMDNEGDMRIGPSINFTCPTLQEFRNGIWNERNPNDLF